MLLIIGIHSISVTCYISIYVGFFLLPTCNIFKDLTVTASSVPIAVVVAVQIQCMGSAVTGLQESKSGGFQLLPPGFPSHSTGKKCPTHRRQVDNRRLKEKKFDNKKKFLLWTTRKNHSNRHQEKCKEESWWQQWPPSLRHYSLLAPPLSLEPTCKLQHFHPLQFVARTWV